MQTETEKLQSEISACEICADRFAETATAHKPRPVAWFGGGAKILIAGQAPGLRVHQSGKPFSDPSGDRLRNWLGIAEDIFYDRKRVAILPMAFCFPGYDEKGSDLPPPSVCAATWRKRVMALYPVVPLTVLVGGYAHKWHLSAARNVTETVKAWRENSAAVFPLPHPSWRNSGWINKNPWFEELLVPELRKRVKEVLDG